MTLSYEQILALAEAGHVIHVHIGSGQSSGGNGDDPDIPPDPDDPGSTVVYGKGNEERARLKLWTPYNHNGVLQENKSDPPRLIMLEASHLEEGTTLSIQNSDEFIIWPDGDVDNADSGSAFKAFYRIAKFRNEDKFAGDYLREPTKKPYADIYPIFYVPKDLVEIIKK